MMYPEFLIKRNRPRRVGLFQKFPLKYPYKVSPQMVLDRRTQLGADNKSSVVRNCILSGILIHFMRMKFLFAGIVLTSFIAFTLFGVFGMAHANEHGYDGGCVAATIQGADCPKKMSLVDFFAFHLDAFRGFSLATAGESLLISLLTLVLFAAGVGLGILLNSLAPPPLNLAYARYEHWLFPNSLHKHKFTRWLALHENSPAAL